MSLEVELDKLLKIRTNGRDDSNSNLTNYPYEPTPYVVLQALSNSGYIKKGDVVIDYGSGKGRVDFYLAYSLKCRMIGVEYDSRLYNRALDNKKTAISGGKVEFVLENASDYKIPDNATGLYFFNPFSIHVLKDVLYNLRQSLKNFSREVMLFFYYPSDEYLNVLDNENNLVHVENINCMSMFKKEDRREIISVYKTIK